MIKILKYKIEGLFCVTPCPVYSDFFVGTTACGFCDYCVDINTVEMSVDCGYPNPYHFWDNFPKGKKMMEELRKIKKLKRKDNE